MALEFAPDGSLLFGSQLNHRVLRFHPLSGAYLGDFVTSGSGGLNRPSGVVFGPDGNLHVSARFGDRVHRYGGATGASLRASVPSGVSESSFPVTPSPLPAAPALVGCTSYAQMLFAWPPIICTFGPFGISTTRGLAFTTQPQSSPDSGLLAQAQPHSRCAFP
ncbi:MAG: hypothetical protein JNJ88_11905 [Planctomycetes bacterium]|nr:hypothetical protein [Planctomycetota bacterium]